MSVRESAMPLNAAVLGPGGLQVLDVNRAMGEVRAALSTNGASSQDVYAVLVYGKHQRPSEFNPLTAANAVLQAYWKAWRSLSRLNVSPSPKPFDLRKISVPGVSDLYVYSGSATAKEVQKKMSIAEGVYVILSHLDVSLLGRMELPALPEPFGELPVVIQQWQASYELSRNIARMGPRILFYKSQSLHRGAQTDRNSETLSRESGIVSPIVCKLSRCLLSVQKLRYTDH